MDYGRRGDYGILDCRPAHGRDPDDLDLARLPVHGLAAGRRLEHYAGTVGGGVIIDWLDYGILITD